MKLVRVHTKSEGYFDRDRVPFAIYSQASIMLGDEICPLFAV